MPAKAPPNVFAIGLPEKPKPSLWQRLRRCEESPSVKRIEPSASKHHPLPAKLHALRLKQPPLPGPLRKRAIGPHNPVPRRIAGVRLAEHTAGKARRPRRDVSIRPDVTRRDRADAAQDRVVGVVGRFVRHEADVASRGSQTPGRSRASACEAASGVSKGHPMRMMCDRSGG
jgi:hypothetical protein